MDEGTQKREWLKCSRSFGYFVDTYIRIYDAIIGDWVPFKLWPRQTLLAEIIMTFRLVLVLKARQLGITWLCLSYLLWLMIFRPAATTMLFSRRETEAVYLMWRLREMHNRLPEFLSAREVITKNTLALVFSNGSSAFAFPTTAGDSYTATAVLIDEADLIPNLDSLMAAVKPTIDGGGKMMMISRSNKEDPVSPFKNMFKAAMRGETPWKWVFLPWWSRPERTSEWYSDIKNEIFGRTLSYDELYEQYPATPEEALAPVELDKRFNPKKLDGIYEPMGALSKDDLPFLTVYKRPTLIGRYVIGADPAEGNPKSDPSSATVADLDTGEEMAVLAGQIEPIVFATYLEQLSRMYNDAKVMVERNNHGHVIITELAPDLLLAGMDEKPGWHTSAKSKAHMYSHAVDVIASGRGKVHSRDTMEQMMSIEGATLKAPEGLNDDQSTSYCLCLLSMEVDAPLPFAMSYRDQMYEVSKSDPRRRRVSRFPRMGSRRSVPKIV